MNVEFRSKCGKDAEWTPWHNLLGVQYPSNQHIIAVLKDWSEPGDGLKPVVAIKTGNSVRQWRLQ